MLRLRTLGTIALWSGDTRLLPGRRKVLALLAYLCRRNERPVDRGALAELFWPGAEFQSRQSLRQALSELRACLGPGFEPNELAVQVPRGLVQVDATEFEARVAAADFESAIALWDGEEFLPGLDEIGCADWRSWLDGERAGLRRRLLLALEQAQQHAAQQQRWDSAIGFAERWRAIDAADQRAWCALITSLTHAGRASEALARHAEFLQQNELTPSREFLELERFARERLRPAAFDGRALLSPAFVGRDEVVHRLLAVWESASTTAGRVVVIEGGSGLGKSRLCQEFARRVRAGPPRAMVLEGRAFASERNQPGSAVRPLLAELAKASGIGAAPPDVLSAMAELIPELRERFPTLPAARSPTGQAVRRALSDVAEETPVLLLLDDAWESDALSQSLLAETFRRPPAHVLLVLSGRPDSQADTPLNTDFRQASVEIERIRLEPFERSTIAALLGSVAPIDAAALTVLAERLDQEAVGAPGSILDVVQQLVNAGTLGPDSSGQLTLLGPLAVPLPVAQQTRALTQERLDRLDATARGLAEAAAVLGKRIDPEVLEAVARLAPEAYRAGLGELLARRLLRPSDAAGSGFEFAGESERRAVYERTTPSTRRALHQRAARVYSALGGDAESKRQAAWHRARAGARRFWRAAALGGLGTAAAIAGLMLVYRSGADAAARGPERKLVVMAFTNETGDSSLNPLGRIAADWLSQGIARTGLIPVAPPLLQTPGREGLPLTAGREAQASLVISGSLFRTGDSLYFRADFTGVAEAKLLQSVGPEVTSRGNPLVAIEQLRRRTIAALAPWLDTRLAAAAGVEGSPPSFEAYRAFAEGLDFFYRRQPVPALASFRHAYSLDTSYATPLVYAMWLEENSNHFPQLDSLVAILLPRRSELAPYDQLAVDFQVARLHGDWAGQYSAARAAAQLAPQSFIAAYSLPRAARALNRPGEALEFLRRIDPDHGEASRLPGYWAQRSEALHMLGKYAEQLAVAHEVRRRFAADNRSYSYQIQALAALGRIAELDAVLREMLLLPADTVWGSPAMAFYLLAADELGAHGQERHRDTVLARALRYAEELPVSIQRVPMHRYQVGEVLFRLGRLPEARRALEQVLEGPQPAGASIIDLRARIGMIAALQGDLATVEAVDRWLQNPGRGYLFGQNTEYRGALQALLGHREAAMELLRQAMAEGRPYDSGKHNYPEYHGLRDYPAFEEWLRPKG